jgi:RHS repeat-associated protein
VARSSISRRVFWGWLPLLVSGALLAGLVSAVSVLPRQTAAAGSTLAGDGLFVPTTPTRIYTTPDVGATSTVTIDPRTVTDTPLPSSGVGAVAVQVTVASPSTTGTLRLFPADTSNPAVNSLSYTSGSSETAFATTRLSSAGFKLRNTGNQAVSVKVDVVGYWTDSSAAGAGSSYIPQVSQRLLTGVDVDSSSTVKVTVPGLAGVPEDDVAAVMVHTNVWAASSTGRLVASADGASISGATSDLQLVASQRVENQFPVEMGGNGKLAFTLGGSSVSAKMTVDVVGYFVAGSSGELNDTFVPVDPVRAFSWDTQGNRVQASATKSFDFTSGGAAIPSGSDAVVVAVSAFGQPSGETTGLVAYPADADTGSMSTAYSVYAANGETDTTLLTLDLDSSGVATFENTSSETANVYGDVVGYLSNDDRLPSAPRKVAAVPGDGEATVTWKAPVDLGSPAATEYRVKASPDGAETTVSVPTTSATVTGLDNGTKYRFRVTATSTRGATTSQPSSRITPTEPSGPLIGGAGQVTTLAGDGQSSTTTGSANQTSFSPTAVIADGGTTYVGTDDAIVVVAGDGSSTLLAGTPGTSNCTGSNLQGVTDLALDGGWVYSASACGLRKTAVSTGTTTAMTTTGAGTVKAVTAPGNGYLYYLKGSGSTVYRYDLTANTSASWGSIPGNCGAIGVTLASNGSAVFTGSYSCSQTNTRLTRLELSNAASTILSDSSGLLSDAITADDTHVYAGVTLSTQSGNGQRTDGPRLYRFNASTGARKYLTGSSTGYLDGDEDQTYIGSLDDVAVNNEGVVIADGTSNRLRLATTGQRLTAQQRSAVHDGIGPTRADIDTLDTFNDPKGVVVVGKYAYVSDDDAVWKINLANGNSSVLAGQLGSPGLIDAPAGADVQVSAGRLDYDGQWLYLLQSGRYRRIDPQTGATSVAAGSSAYNIDGAYGIGPDGKIYGMASSLTSLSVVDPNSGARSTFASLPQYGMPAGTDYPQDIAVDDEYVWVLRSDTTNFDTRTNYYLTRVSLANPAQIDSFTFSKNYGSVGSVRTGQLTSVGDSLYVITDVNDQTVSPSQDLIQLWQINKASPSSATLITGGTHVDTDGVDGTFADVEQITSDGVNLYTVGRGTSDHLRIIRQGPEPTASGGLDGSDEVTGGGNPSIPASASSCVCVGDPVQLNTGALVEAETDISIPGRGPAVAFTRTYDSTKASVAGRFGYGWTDSYDMTLTQNAPSAGYVTVKQENGSTVIFESTSAGYVPSSETMAKLVDNDDGTWTFTRERTMKYTFDSGGKLTAVTDLDGYQTTLSYSSGKLQTITDPAGRTLTLSYTSGFVTQLKDMNDGGQRTVSYAYSGSELTSVTNVNGGLTQFTYDGSHRLETIRDPLYDAGVSTVLHKVVNTYDSNGAVTSQVDKRGEVTGFDYDVNATTGYTTVTVTHPEQNVDQYVFLRGVLLSKTQGLGAAEESTETYEPDPVTLLPARVTDGAGGVTEYEYDARGNPIVVTDPLGKSVRTDYDRYNNPTLVTDQANRLTEMVWDKTHLLSSTRVLETSGQGDQDATTQYSYDPNEPADLLTIDDPLDHTTTFTYNQYGNRTSVEDATGRTSTTTYNSRGWVTATVTAEGNSPGKTATDYDTVYSDFDGFGNPETVTDPYNKASTYAYNVMGWLTDVTDPDSNHTHTDYDPDGRVVQVIRPNDTAQVPDRLATSYDGNGNLESQTDAAGESTSYSYDALNRIVDVTDPLSRVLSSTEYDGAGRPTVMTQPADGGGNLTTTMSYDDAGQLRAIDYSDATPDVTFDYDTVGRRIEMVDGTGTSTYTYDTLDRLTAVENGAGAQIGYQYDLADRLQVLTYPGSAGSVDYNYDNANRMTALDDFGGQTTTSFDYDPNGALDTTTYPNSVVGAVDRDRMGRVTNISHDNGGTNLASFDYTYRDSSLLDTSNQTGTPGANHTFGWTDNSQLESVTGGTQAQGAGTYGFDLADNLTTLPGATQTFDDANQLTTTTPSVGAATTYTYTARGQRKTATTSGNTDTYTWDTAGRLTGFTPNSGAAYTYAADGSGLRSSATTGGNTDQWTWDSSTSLPKLLSDGDYWFLYGPNGTPIEQIDRTSSTKLWLHDDLLGSTRLLTNTAGSAAATFAYTAFGALVNTTGTGDTPLRFTGQYTDPTGLIYLRARVYDPTTGVFLLRDPITVVTRDPYGYVAGNPLQRVDPTGLDWIQDAGDWAAGFGDTVTFGATEWVREQLGVNGAVNKCSVFYDWGGNGGVVASAAPIGQAGALVGASRWAVGVTRSGSLLERAPLVGSASRLFGNNTLRAAAEGLLNQRKLPIKFGWGVMRYGEGARSVFRVGTPRWFYPGGHIDLFYGGVL